MQIPHESARRLPAGPGSRKQRVPEAAGRDGLNRKHPGSAWGGDCAPAEPAVAHLVQALEAEIIPRLLQAHRPVVPDLLSLAAVSARPCTSEIQTFAELMLQHDPDPVAARVAAWRSRGAGIDSVWLELLAPAARQLGERWLDDTCSFTDVTVGVGHLQRLLLELSPAFWSEAPPRAKWALQPPGRRALLLPAPGEQHTFGVAMLGEFFGRAGWDVAGAEAGASSHALDRVRRESFDLIGLSVGSQARLQGLASYIVSLRKFSRNRDIVVMVGGPIFSDSPELVVRLGADASGADAPAALACAEACFAGQRAHR